MVRVALHVLIAGGAQHDHADIGNPVNTGAAHLGLNLAGLVALCLLYIEHYAQISRLIAAVIANSLCVTGGLLVFNPDIAWYAGLSGLLHGLLALHALLDLPRHRLLSASLLVGLGLKLAYELTAGPSATVAQLIGAPVIVMAHVYGSIAGLAVALASLARQFRNAD